MTLAHKFGATSQSLRHLHYLSDWDMASTINQLKHNTLASKDKYG
jgi:hypothetical protein